MDIQSMQDQKLGQKLLINLRNKEIQWSTKRCHCYMMIPSFNITVYTVIQILILHINKEYCDKFKQHFQSIKRVTIFL